MTLRLGARGDDVRTLQARLELAGFPAARDGVFGPRTEAALCAYQRFSGLVDDGVAGERTIAALESDARASCWPGLETFRGSVGFLLAWEGHRGRPYWPGHHSGVTLDPGYDLGYRTDPGELRRLYGWLSEEQLEALVRCAGIRGAPARVRLRGAVDRVRVDRLQAASVLPAIAAPYWQEVTQRFEGLEAGPPGAHTAILSLGYNRGPRNADLDALRCPIAAGDWRTVAARIRLMQQDHPLAGVRRRRRAEAQLVEEELAR